MNIISIYFNFIRKNIITALAVVLVGEFLYSAVSLLTLPFYNEVIEVSLQTDKVSLKELLIKAALLVVMYLTSVCFVKLIYPSFLAKCNKYLRNQIITQIKHTDLFYVKEKSLGNLLKAFDKVEVISKYFFQICACVIKILFVVALNLYLIIYVHWLLIIVLVFLFIVLISLQLVVRPLQNKQEEIWEQEGKTLIFIDSAIRTMHLVKTYMIEKHMEDSFNGHVDQIVEIEKKRILLANTVEVVQQVTKTVVILLTPIICWVLIERGIVPVNTVIIASFSFFLLANGIMELIQLLSDISYTKAAIKLINQYFAVPNTEVKNRINSGNHDLRIKDLTFSYGSHVVFDRCSIVFPDHGLIAIVGDSGSGKSTLFGLMLGQLLPQSGEILVGGQRVSDLNPDYIAYMPQESILFNGTVTDNILYADEGLVSADADSVISYLDIEKQINEMKEGMNTLINFNADNLSGGQKQLICLCRALCKKNTYILILDEPTSSQSTDLEEKIVKKLKQISKNKLIIISAHTSEVLHNADYIYRICNESLMPVKVEDLKYE